MTDPRSGAEPVSDELDAWASVRVGDDLERLDDLRVERDPTPAHRLSNEAWTLLLRSSGRGLQAGGAVRGPAGSELRDAGLLGRFGGLTETGQDLATTVLEGARTVLWRRESGAAGVWSCWRREGRAVVVARTAADRAGLDDATNDVSALPSAVALARLLAWHRIAPAWTLTDGDPVQVPAEAVERRVGDPAEPAPAGIGPVLAHAWAAGPWLEVTVQRADGGTTRSVRAGSTGWWGVEPVGSEAVRLHPTPSGGLVADLLESWT